MIGYTRIGTGREGVIVLEGWFGDYTVFEPTIPYLDTDTFTYAFMDYRGYGKSIDMEGNHTMQETPVYLATVMENFMREQT